MQVDSAVVIVSRLEAQAAVIKGAMWNNGSHMYSGEETIRQQVCVTVISPPLLFAKAAEPFFSALFSYLFMGDMPPVPVLLTLIPIVGGVVIASASEASFNWGGFLSAVASNITFQSRNVLSKKLMISSVS